jgi:MarR family transcriptional regulator, transcriptional regulator for hemolysin
MPMNTNERFLHALHGSARAWRTALERRLKAHGLTTAAWSALTATVDSLAPPSQRELARQLGVDGATLVATIDRLAGAGLVERLPGTHDRRVKLVAPTARGQALARQVTIEAAELRQLTVAQLEAGEIAVAADVLERLQRLLEAT